MSKRNPKPTIDDLCAVCEKPYAATHEVYFGTANRQISIAYGFQEKLCYKHHNDPSNKVSNPHFNIEVDDALKQKFQRIFEETHTREEFMKLIGRNYIMED